jgi:20S proteasome alpha/beta subunit
VDVTIAAGFHCNEGIVLCADTQETITGFIKGYEGKIVTNFLGGDAAVAIAGSGTSDYIRTAKEKAVEGLHGLKELREIRDKIETNLISFFDIHLSRWSGFVENERPTVELLIAVTTKHSGFGLFHWSGTSFHLTHQKAIGAGILLANTLIQQYCIGNFTLDELTSLAVFIVNKVKKHVDTCGGNTHMVLLKRGGDFGVPDDTLLKKLEAEAEKMEAVSVENLKKKIAAKRIKITWFGSSFGAPMITEDVKETKP